MNMQSTQDGVFNYTKDVECKTLKEAREIIRDLTSNYKNAFAHHRLNASGASEYDYLSVENNIFKQTVSEIKMDGNKNLTHPYN